MSSFRSTLVDVCVWEREREKETIRKSHVATPFAIYNDPRAVFWEFLPILRISTNFENFYQLCGFVRGECSQKNIALVIEEIMCRVAASFDILCRVEPRWTYDVGYGVATISRLLKFTGLYCRI